MGNALAQKDPPLPPRPAVDLSEFKTVDKLITTRVTRARPGPVSLPGYLGINVKADKGALAVSMVQPASPAAKAGIKPGDVVTEAGRPAAVHGDDLRRIAAGQGARRHRCHDRPSRERSHRCARHP